MPSSFQRLDPEVRAIGDGLLAYLSGAAATLDIALAVQPGPGQRSAATTLRTTERNALLRRAAEQFFADRKPTQQAYELHRAITRYAASSWPREKQARIERPSAPLGEGGGDPPTRVGARKAPPV